jgi:diguanylate cyclase (GGDEF)-like protein
MGNYFYHNGHFRTFFRQLIKDGKPVWRDPYDDHNLGVRRISYVVPVYSQGTCIAFLGMSIRMDTLVKMLSEAKIYDTGYAVLFSDEGEIFYHPEYPNGASTTLQDLGLESYAERLKGRDSNTDLFTYYYKGQKKEMAFITLKNQMNLGIVAPDAEIYQERSFTYGRLLFLTILFGIFTSGLAIIAANRIIAPLKEIDAAARRMGKGNYDTFVASQREDEVGELAQNMNQTMVLMKGMFDRLEKQALEDNLTQVKNTRAYQLKVQELDGLIRKDPAQVLPFGVLMVDVNGLKGINDRFGHARGNDVLLRTVKYICDLFKHSPVYRVGGDEFVVILQNEDYANRKAILTQLKPWNRKRNYEDDRPWDQLAFASGFSAYDPENDINFLHVFLRADAAMYENKKKAEGNRVR